MRTQVGIIGAGPAGLLLSHLLYLQGIDSVVLEIRSREAIESTIRAGVLEEGTVNVLTEAGVGDRIKREGLIQHGITIRFNGEDHKVDITDLTGGRTFTIYSQHEVIKDLVKARLDSKGTIYFNVSDVSVHDITTTNPKIRFKYDDTMHELNCDYIIGCDGAHGVCQKAILNFCNKFTRTYPYAWFGIITKTPPWEHGLIYTYHDRGFTLVSSRSLEVQRMCFQCDPNDKITDWPDERIAKELRLRLATNDGWELVEGPISHKAIFPMRTFVVEPMQHGRLFLAGDAAHIVPPTGAKGLNLAVADVKILAKALIEFYASGNAELLDKYSETALQKIWRAEYFSWWMTTLLHRASNDSSFESHIQLAALEYVTSSHAASASLAENYVGLENIPFHG